MKNPANHALTPLGKGAISHRPSSIRDAQHAGFGARTSRPAPADVIPPASSSQLIS